MMVGRWMLMRVLGVVVLISLSGAAHAKAPGNDPVLAERLFRQARQLMAEGHFERACVKFAESLAAEPATGTLLNLASCHETEGKLALAWAEFSEAAALAKQEGRKDRAAFAEKHLGALDQQLPRLTVVVSAKDTVGLEVQIDGRSIGRAGWGVATPFDPGEHEVRAVAPGKQAWSTRVVLVRSAPPTDVVIPALLDASVASASENSGRARALRSPGAAQPATAPTDGGLLTRGRVAAALMAVGGVSLVTGAVFAWQARSHWNTRNRFCPMGDDSCSIEAVPASQQANRAATVANVALGIGLVGVAAGTFVYISAPDTEARTPEAHALKPTKKVQLLPFVAGALMGVRARFRF